MGHRNVILTINQNAYRHMEKLNACQQKVTDGARDGEGEKVILLICSSSKQICVELITEAFWSWFDC